ncbi:2'-5'-oligoadenylate synthase 1-like isoform X2 [Dama dama]|uniref:2'-5'-oligoadenylate synthase 1-like isoform X2 n=1 Tax=Dama dama TaxID=30532 RepID=UPI002A35E4BC|nr:2'-5'-oligoadenylate synthase 1-like isoform X2 [Dama dama]
MMGLSHTPAKSLDKFIEDHLLPNEEFRTQVKEAIDIICTFLKERCFQCARHRVRVSKVVKGGSSGKGTTLRGRSDADLVVFLTNLTSFQEQLKHRGEFIDEIRRQLEACQREETFEVKFEVQKQQWENPRVLSFVLRSPKLNQEVEFDVLPAFDALAHPRVQGTGERRRVLPLLHGAAARLPEESSNQAEEPHPPGEALVPTGMAVTNGLCKTKWKNNLPPQYALELLTVYAWEQGSAEPEFNTAQGFQTVLELILKHQDLCIYWKKYYDFENPTLGQYLRGQLAKRRPVILDPADPTGNVAGEEPQRWQLLAQEVRVWLRYSCCKNLDGTPVSTWYVPVTPPHYAYDRMAR